MVESSTHQQVGYILRSYPRYSQTFILNEILALEQRGLRLQIFALENPREEIVQEQVSNIRARIHYLNSTGQPARGKGLLRHLRLLFSAPQRYFTTLLFVIKGSGLDAGYRNATRFQCFFMAVTLASEIRHKGQEIRHLHAHFAHDPALVALLAHKLAGISYSFTAHARDLYQLAMPGLQERSRVAKAVVTCCAENRSYLAKSLPESQHQKIRLIHHGVDLQVFSPPKTRQASSEKPIILSVGRLVEKKGFPVLIEAYRKLKQAGTPFNALIYGDGPMYKELAGLIEQYGLEGWVTLGGAISQQKLVPLYQQADLFALTPSITTDGDRDGIPNVLVEAMACGLPVVSTAVAGIPELVTHDHNGLLYHPDDVDGIASGLSSLLRDPDRRNRLGKAAQQTVADHFDLRAGAHQMSELFLQVQAV